MHGSSNYRTGSIVDEKSVLLIRFVLWWHLVYCILCLKMSFVLIDYIDTRQSDSGCAIKRDTFFKMCVLTCTLIRYSILRIEET